MTHPAHIDIANRLVADLANDAPPMPGRETRVSVDRYTDPARCEAEREAIFRRFPLIAAHASELSEPGMSMSFDATGVPVILVRGKDGVVRGFLNACRHRATRLVKGAPCARKALVCPYHAWTYDLEGKLIDIPHRAAFPEVDPGRRGLVPVPVEEAHGFIWVTTRRADECPPLSLDEFLGPIGSELGGFGLADHVLYENVSTVRNANWKLAIDAFLEAYHIRVLHKRSVYPFFLDGRAMSDEVGYHLRSAATRRAAVDAYRDGVDMADVDLRQYVTPTYFLFPHTILIAHPDFTSIITVYPLAADKLRWVHRFFIPEAPTTAAAEGHWRRSFELIERSVMQAEDLMIAEEIQAGLASGANRDMVFGTLEGNLARFHQLVDEQVAGLPAA